MLSATGLIISFINKFVIMHYCNSNIVVLSRFEVFSRLSYTLSHKFTDHSSSLLHSLSLFVSFSPSSSPLISSSFHLYIKVIYHQDQTQYVRASDRLIYWWVSSVSVSFLIGVEGQGLRDTFLKRSLFDYWCFWHVSCFLAWAWPLWIARPHVNATFDLNSWDPKKCGQPLPAVAVVKRLSGLFLFYSALPCFW